jgi:hypothetical protein
MGVLMGRPLAWYVIEAARLALAVAFVWAVVTLTGFLP